MIDQTLQPWQEQADLIGLYRNMPEDVYHAHPSVSQSLLKELQKSPAHCWHRINHGLEATDHMNKGTAFHQLLLEPQRLEKEVVAFSGRRDPRTKSYKEFLEAHTGKIILTQQDYDDLQVMRDRLYSTQWGTTLLGNGYPEVSFFWKDTESNISCRGRADFLRRDGIIVDVKTSSDASSREFSRKAANMGYHLQVAMYLRGIEAVTGIRPQHFVFIVVENKAPFLPAFYALDDSAIAAADARLSELLELFAHCQETGNWPGYPDDMLLLNLPQWAFTAQENLQ